MFANMKRIHFQKSSHFAWLVKKVAYLKSEEIYFVFFYFATNSKHTIIWYKYPGQEICNIDVTGILKLSAVCTVRVLPLLAGRWIRIRMYTLRTSFYSSVQEHLDLKRLSQESETAVQWVFIVAVSVKCIFVLATAASRGEGLGGGGGGVWGEKKKKNNWGV